MGPRGSIVQIASYATQADFHYGSSHFARNYAYQAFTSFVPAMNEVEDFADVVAGLHASGTLPASSATMMFNGVLGGRASVPSDNAVGDVLRLAAGFEAFVGCATNDCLSPKEDPYMNLDAYDLANFKVIQAIIDEVRPFVRGKYVNEWISKGGLGFPSSSNFWDDRSYNRLLQIKQGVDP